MNAKISARILRIAGGLIAYTAFAAFLLAIAMQTYRWLREGEWPHIGVSDGLRALLAYAGVDDGGSGRLAELARWLDTPTDWLGWHEVLDVIPASVALFLVSMLGNFLHVYGGDLSAANEEGSES